jgi:hypothetical protein
VKFPIGGKVRELISMTRCNSGTDSKVWMEEDALYLHVHLLRPKDISFGRNFSYQEEKQ